MKGTQLRGRDKIVNVIGLPKEDSCLLVLGDVIYIITVVFMLHLKVLRNSPPLFYKWDYKVALEVLWMDLLSNKIKTRDCKDYTEFESYPLL